MAQDDVLELSPLSETEREVCEAAVNHFLEEDFQTSADILASIVAIRPNDYRFKHNLAVAEFRQRSCTEWKKFAEDLEKVFSDAKIPSDPDSLHPENVQFPVLWFNLAVLYYHQKRYRKALVVVEKLSKTFSNVMTPLTKRTKLLLIDILIKLHLYERALNEIEVFETQLRPDSADISGNSSKASQGQSQQQEAVSGDLRFESEVKIKLQQYKTHCYLGLKSLKAGKKECRQLFMSTGSSHPAAYVGTCLKAYHDYLRGNVKKAHKILTNLRQPGSEIEFHENVLQRFGDPMNIICLNNEGCSDFYLCKPTVAGTNFMKAAQEFDKYAKLSQTKLPLHATKINVKLELMYNFGVTLLNLKRPVEAFAYLNTCLKFYFNNPRLWLRVAECCIQIHKSENDHHLNLSMERRNLIKEVKGTESKKLVFVNPGKAYKPDDAEENNANDREKREQPTLDYARMCLENALRLVESDSVTNEGLVYVRPSTPISNVQEINGLHAAILCASAYVNLTLENYPLAIKRCNQLMALQNIPGAYQYLAKMYLGEAYFKFGQLGKAHEALFQDNACDITYIVSLDAEDKKDDAGSECSWPGQSAGGNGILKPITDWYPNDDFTARAILVYNQAVILASSGDLDKASEVLRAWISKNEGRPLAPEFMKLAVYLHIRLGNVAKAKSLLKNSKN